MDIKYWDKQNKIYISKEEAMSKYMHGIRRHVYVKIDDLIKGGGLPKENLSFNCDYVIICKKQAYKLVNPIDHPAPNTITLEDNWAGEVVMVENNKGQGLLDLKTGELIIPFSKSNYEIYPISKDYFCIIDPSLENKKIVNRKQVVLDEIHGTYVKSSDKLMRHSIKRSNGQYVLDGRITISSLQRKEQTIADHKNLEKTISNLKKSGMTIEELLKLVNKMYNRHDPNMGM